MKCWSFVFLLIMVGCCEPCCGQTTSWVDGPRDPDQVHLVVDGKQVGTWFRTSHQYFPYTEGQWSRDPCPLPQWAPLPPGIIFQNFGVDFQTPPPKEERWRLNGVEVPRERAIEAELKDDSHLPWFVYIGPRETHAQILADLKATGLNSQFRIQMYVPGEWVEKDRDGKPCLPQGITIIGADRKAVGRIESYSDSNDLLGLLRKTRPNFDPSAIPNLRLPSFHIPLHLIGIVILVVLLVVAFLKKRS